MTRTNTTTTPESRRASRALLDAQDALSAAKRAAADSEWERALEALAQLRTATDRAAAAWGGLLAAATEETQP